jgi:uncharacterized membrane protein
MNQSLPNTPLSSQDDEAKTHALIAYALMLAGLLTVVFWFFGGIWAIVKKSDTEGSRFSDHYNNLISTFWWGIFWAIVGGLLSLIFVGYIILGILWFWAVYRLIKGLAKLTSNRAYES